MTDALGRSHFAQRLNSRASPEITVWRSWLTTAICEGPPAARLNQLGCLFGSARNRRHLARCPKGLERN
jgi:hypothetical protein